MDFLDEVVSAKLKEIETLKSLSPILPSHSGRRSLIKAIMGKDFSIIAEIKRKSPSEGRLRDLNVSETAKIYESSGAAAVSVITDKGFFNGSIRDIFDARSSIKVPVLRKDFIVDELQLRESAGCGADAVLIISKILKGQTASYVDIAHDLGLECLVEVHDANDLSYALDSDAELIGVNNRDLRTLNVDLAVSEMIAGDIPKNRPFISESGIKTVADVMRMKATGAKAVLVGSSIMKSNDIAGKISELMGK